MGNTTHFCGNNCHSWCRVTSLPSLRPRYVAVRALGGERMEARFLYSPVEWQEEEGFELLLSALDAPSGGGEEQPPSHSLKARAVFSNRLNTPSVDGWQSHKNRRTSRSEAPNVASCGSIRLPVAAKKDGKM